MEPRETSWCNSDSVEWNPGKQTSQCNSDGCHVHEVVFVSAQLQSRASTPAPSCHEGQMSKSVIFCYGIILLYTKHVPLPRQPPVGLIKELIGQQLGREKLARRVKLREHWEE